MRMSIAWCVLATVCLADRPIFLVTPAGVYQSIVATNGKPGPWNKIDADVIVSGFSNVPDTPVPPDVPPIVDSIVTKIAAISKTVLKDKDDATAVAAIVDSFSKLDLSAGEFREVMKMAVPIADTAIGAEGRLNEWSEQCLKVTADSAKLKAGLVSAWGVSQDTLDSIYHAASNREEAVTGEAINWTKLIEIIQMILTLLKNLGFGGGS